MDGGGRNLHALMRKAQNWIAGGRKSGLETASVLPRPLRRLVRFAASLENLNLPKYAGIGLAAAFLSTTGLYGMVVGDHTGSVVHATTGSIGFGIDQVRIAGNTHTSEIDIIQQLHLSGSTSLIGLNVDETRTNLLRLPWIEDVSVEKIYPDTINIKIEERQPFAIWQHGQEHSVIERNGSVIVALGNNQFSHLPLFVGLGAEKAAAQFSSEFSDWPEFQSRARVFLRVSDRRWDIRFDNGVTVKLATGDIDTSLKRLARLERDQQILARDIASVDLRLHDRVAIQLTEDARMRRDEAIAERAKLIKAKGRRL